MKFSEQLAELSKQSFKKEVKRVANLAASNVIDAACEGVSKTDLFIGDSRSKKEILELKMSKKFLKSLEKELEGVKVNVKEEVVVGLLGKSVKQYFLVFNWGVEKNGK